MAGRRSAGPAGRWLVLMALVLIAASCGGGDNNSANTTTTAASPDSVGVVGTTAPGPTQADDTTETTVVVPDDRPIAPLTGLPQDDEAFLGRPAILAKVDNIEGLARPQVGLSEADIVVEEKIEGSSTRLAAIYHSTPAPEIGPIRSGRSTDVFLIHALNTPGLVMTGANAVMLNQLLSSPVRNYTLDARTDAYERRDPERPRPDHYFTSTGPFWVDEPDLGAPPPAWFRYRAPDDALTDLARPAETVDMNWGLGPGAAPVSYDWDGGTETWLRIQAGTDHVEEDGTRLAPQNVLVQFVRYIDTGLVDPANSPIPEAQLVGSGVLWVFTDGHIIEGQWERESLASPTRWLDISGAEIQLTPGQTWVELVREGEASYR